MRSVFLVLEEGVLRKDRILHCEYGVPRACRTLRNTFPCTVRSGTDNGTSGSATRDPCNLGNKHTCSSRNRDGNSNEFSTDGSSAAPPYRSTSRKTCTTDEVGLEDRLCSRLREDIIVQAYRISYVLAACGSGRSAARQ